ncbi:MAG: hypothetical protein V4685_09720 [Bacteroidota bacterium]
MSNELKDILSNSNKDIDNQQLMDYLSNQLNQTQQHEVEKTMADDAFVNDAVEGLQQMPGNKDINTYVEQLNDELHRQIAKNKKRKEKRRLKDSPYTYITIIILLLLMVISFVVVKKYLDNKKKAEQNKVVVGMVIHQNKTHS